MIISAYISAVVYAWIAAQGLKYLVSAVSQGGFRRNLRQLYVSGNMPSAHSASVISLLTVIGYTEGLQSPLFALAALFSAIVMYDAIMVRRSSGEQGAALLELIAFTKFKTILPRVAKGHTPLEVLGGVLVGLSVGLVVIFTIV